MLPVDYTFTSADQGKHTFQVTFKTTGSQSLAVTDTANTSLKAAGNVSVTTSAQLVVLTGLGQTATAGAPQSVTVTLKDNFGNVVTSYVGAVHFTSTDGQAVLPHPTTLSRLPTRASIPSRSPSTLPALNRSASLTRRTTPSRPPPALQSRVRPATGGPQAASGRPRLLERLRA